MDTEPHLPEPPAEALDLATVLAALADPVRLRIVQGLDADGERICGTFDLGVSKATRSHHFKVLREAGLTRTRLEGATRHVRLRREDLEARFPGLLTAVLAGAAAPVA